MINFVAYFDSSIKNIDMQTANEIVINVQEIEPRLRHLTIFQTFDELQEGESLIIHNNHDPIPVYHQLMNIRGDVFTWEYLQDGPQWWDIRVTKKSNAQQQIFTTPQGELVLNIPAIEPKLKHPSIFKVFDNTKPGDSFIIHNDHDPKPVYYQLLGERGDVFTWEYLEQGPQWWDVRVTLKATIQDKPTETNTTIVSNATSASSQKEIVIDVPTIEPKLKHPTIFQVFDELQAGESLIIHNDHDPKPVYYQLLGERGDVFIWEYLEQGPQWWDVRVTRKGAQDHQTVGQIAAKDLRKAEVFKKYGIDFCCGGKKTVREACAEKGIDATIVEQELQQPVQNVTKSTQNFDEWNLDFLADYIVNTHHNYVRKYLPEIFGYAAKVAQVHGDKHPELIPINDLVKSIHKELSEHLVEEENTVFPAIKEFVKASNASALPERSALQSILQKMENEHEQVGKHLESIRQLSNNYAIPQDACSSYQLLFKMLDEFEADLFVHIHLENNILFAKARDLVASK